jgi:tetratricopeptide (TPR) repeat protein
MIFAFDPFVGYFSGTLYDTVIDAGTPLLTYRLGSLATLTALAFFAAETTRREPGGGLRLNMRTWRAGLGVLAGLVSLGIFVAGPELGHFSTPTTIAHELGAEKHGKRCDVVYPSTTRELEANLLVKDCDEELAAVEERLGARGPARVRAFFFRDADQKKRLMGAAHTYIAKPWREEVYLQLAGYPHPALGHELGHVVAGSFGHGPFRIAGSAGGLVPNPGLIEGVAVFSSPDDEDLTDLQWARAMKQIGILPRMERVFSLGFLGDASSKSYTLAGAFITWIAERWGVETVRKWYGGADVTALTGEAWPALDRDFSARLERVPLPAEAESFARARFARPGIFGRRCPHVVDALRHEADVCRDTQRYADAIRLYREAVAKDPADFQSKKELGAVERRHGDVEEGRKQLERLASSPDVPRTWRDRAEEALADAEMLDGQFDAAAKRYAKLAAGAIDEDAARTFEVKELAAKDEQGAREPVIALLLGDHDRGADPFVGGVSLGRWDEESALAARAHETGTRPRSSLALYLIGKNFVNRAFWEKGAAELRASMDAGPPTARIAREALRQRAKAACARSDAPALAEIRAILESPKDPFRDAPGSGRRDATLRMIDRCARP